MPTWKLPPKIKIYEALGAIADERIELDGNTSRVYSSSRGKFYTVSYDPDNNSIMANDNGSYWQGYLGYPSIAYLLSTKIISYSPKIAHYLIDIKWKDLNTQLKNDWDKTINHLHKTLTPQQLDLLTTEINRIHEYLKSHPINKLGKRTKPPSGY